MIEFGPLHFNALDLTGLIVNELVVTSYAGRDNEKKSANKIYWNCLCSCGVTTTVRADMLRRGLAQSCGHKLIEKQRARFIAMNIARTMSSGEGSCSVLYSNYRSGANKRGLAFEMSKDEFKQLTKENCFYCDLPPSQISKGSTTNGPYIYNGIDRADNNMGYVTGNLRPCCKTCNLNKGAKSEAEFYEWIARVHRKVFGR